MLYKPTLVSGQTAKFMLYPKSEGGIPQPLQGDVRFPNKFAHV
jgi:hypothetical protein